MPPCPATNSTVIPIGSFGSTIRGRDALPLARDRRHAARPFPSLQASAILTSADCAVEEVAGASDDHSSWRTPVTIILILGLCAVLYMLWLLFNLAAYALPLYAGLGVCISLLHQGDGFLTSISAGFLVGIATLVVGQLLFDFVRSPTLQTAIAILFVLPAAFAGYQLVYCIDRKSVV